MLFIDKISKRFKGADRSAIDTFTLAVQKKQLVTLLGESGCGKTTLLRILCGLETPDAGCVTLGTQTLVDESSWVSPCQRKIGMVFQGGALFPHLKVEQNIAFGLSHVSKKQQRDIVAFNLELVGLQSKAKQYPHHLSGGERQRVALARALAPKPELLLLDEPFSNLDVSMRAELRLQVRDLLKSLQCAAILVSHDPADAEKFGDQCVIMRAGKIAESLSTAALLSSQLDCYCSKLLGLNPIDGSYDTQSQLGI